MVKKNSQIDFSLIRRVVKMMDDSGLAEFEWEKEGMRLRLKKSSDSPSPSAPPRPESEDAVGPGPAADPAGNLVEVTSPMVGTFYRSRSPEGPPLVEVGAAIAPGTIVGIIEAMKVMNEIEADAGGVVAEVLVEDGTPVEFGQPLFRLHSSSPVA